MMRLSEAAIVLNAQLLGADVEFTSVGTDTRKLQPGQLFVALKGENFDGNAFAAQSLENGAVAALVSSHANEVKTGLLVADTRVALGQLAAYWRGKFEIPLAAITGSNGKTTVKEMLASILSIVAGGDEYVLATQGNLNNDIGMPVTLLRLRGQHKFAIAEMGMNHAGEISYLTKLAKPDVALVNNATQAHLGGLGSLGAIASAKGEIFEGLSENGIAVINHDDQFCDYWKGLASRSRIFTFGLNAGADVTANYQLGVDGSQVQMQTPQGNIDFNLPVAGLHNIRNALAASALALNMGASLQQVALGLAQFAGVKGRLQQQPGINGALVIDDTYNANPASMKAAIDVLAKRPAPRLMVMGDMGELGDEAPSLHAEIGLYAKKAGVEKLYLLGELTAEACAAFGEGAQRFDTPETLSDAIKQEMSASATVLVKGSRFMRMERVVNLITTNIKNGEAH